MKPTKGELLAIRTKHWPGTHVSLSAEEQEISDFSYERGVKDGKTEEGWLIVPFIAWLCCGQPVPEGLSYSEQDRYTGMLSDDKPLYEVIEEYLQSQGIPRPE